MSSTALKEDKLAIVARCLEGGESTEDLASLYTRIEPAAPPKPSRRSSDGEGSRKTEVDSNASIKYRTCTWQKTAALLFSEYISLAVMSFPYSYSVLGLVPGLTLTLAQAAFALYTSLIVWEFCLRHPEIQDVCDIGKMLFWNSDVAWYMTAIMFLLNNTFIQGLHVLVISRYLNTMTGHGMCTVGFAAIGAVISFICSLPRTFNTLSKLATVSAFFTFISLMLATVFAASEGHPANYHPDPDHINEDGLKMGGSPLVLLFPALGTTFVSGMSAFLNISYSFVGQITLPSFIAEMKNPHDFKKAIWLVTIAELLVFSFVGTVIYAYTGSQYATAPAFGSLSNELYKKVSFSIMIPTMIFLGVLYASISARFVFFRLFRESRHKEEHTLLGWASWAGILAGTWVVALMVAQIIPFFTDLLSLMGALFDSFFGWIFWGVAYIRMRRAQYGPKFYKTRGLVKGWGGIILNMFIVLLGLYFLGMGTYVSLRSILLDYQKGVIKGVFQCGDNSV